MAEGMISGWTDPVPPDQVDPTRINNEWLAYHESGHAVACYFLLIKFDCVSIEPGPSYLAGVLGMKPADGDREKRDRMLALYAGRAVEKYRTGGKWDHTGAGPDLEQAHRIACDLCNGEGSRASALEGQMEKAATRFVEEHRSEIESLAPVLEREKCLPWRKVKDAIRAARKVGPEK